MPFGRNLHLYLSIIVACSTSGCAYTNVVPVAYSDVSTPGVRVYDLKPLLMVYDKSAQVVLVPNYNRSYAVQFGAFLAKNDFKLQLENGAISKLDSSLDSTAIIDLLKTIAQGLLPPAAKGSADPIKGDDHLNAVYDFDFDINGNLLGLRQIYFDKRLPTPRPQPVALLNQPGNVPGVDAPKAPKPPINSTPPGSDPAKQGWPGR